MDHIVRRSDEDLLERAITTLPGYPVYTSISMSSFGMEEPRLHNPGEVKRYMGMCSNYGLAPFFIRRFIYDHDQRMFVPELKKEFSRALISSKLYGEIADQMNRLLISGEPTGVGFHIPAGPKSAKSWVNDGNVPMMCQSSQKAFDELRSGLLTHSVECGYEVMYASLWLSGFYADPEDPESYTQLSHIFMEKAEGLSTIRLTLYDPESDVLPADAAMKVDISSRDRSRLEDWIEGFRPERPETAHAPQLSVVRD